MLNFNLVCVPIGMIMVAEGTVDFTDNKQTKLEDEHGNISEPEDTTGRLIITVTGGLLIVIGILLIGRCFQS